eukprot:685372_1
MAYPSPHHPPWNTFQQLPYNPNTEEYADDGKLLTVKKKRFTGGGTSNVINASQCKETIKEFVKFHDIESVQLYGDDIAPRTEVDVAAFKAHATTTFYEGFVTSFNTQ